MGTGRYHSYAHKGTMKTQLPNKMKNGALTPANLRYPRLTGLACRLRPATHCAAR